MHATTRRAAFGAIGSIAAAGLIAAQAAKAAIPASCPAWQPVHARYTAAKRAHDAFDSQHFGAIRDLPIGRERNAFLEAVPEPVWQDLDGLCETLSDAEEALIATPAPHLSAVIEKIEMARMRWADFEDWPARWWDAVLTDLRSLAAGVA